MAATVLRAIVITSYSIHYTKLYEGKDARKARAQQREAEKVLRKIEEQIEKLAGEQAALTEEMMSRRDADFAAINTRLAQIQKETKALEIV